MASKFHPAIAAIESDDLEKFKALLAADPSLVTSRSSRSHPTLLQCAVLDGNGKPNNVAKVGSTAASWADHGGHPDLRDLLS